MGDHYGDESQSASDQEDLVGGTDYDDDMSDTEELQFTYCKNSTIALDEPDISASTNDEVNSYFCNSSTTSDTKEPQKSKLILCCMVGMLFISALVLLICFPLYLHQLNVGGEKKHNAYGAMLYISTLITSAFLLATLITSWILKWNVKVHKLPLPWNR